MPKGMAIPMPWRAKVMVVDRSGFPAPDPAGVFEATDQLFLFGIDTDDGQAALEELLFLLGHINKLLVALRALAGEPFGVGVQPVTKVLQKATHGVGTN